MDGSWDIKCDGQSFLSFWAIFAFWSSYKLQHENFEKLKKKPRDTILLHLCITNDNHIMYGSWDMECNWQNFLSFWVIFLAFSPTNNLKNQNFEKMKKKKNAWRYHHFTQKSLGKFITLLDHICLFRKATMVKSS